jgi:N-methylhydantoinase B
VKVFDRGVERRDLVYMMQVNNRTPTFLGDLRAQIGAAQHGARRLAALVKQHGVERIREAVDHSIAFAARRFREEVASWPDGVYEATTYVDHDPIGNQDIAVHVKVTVAGSRLTVDYTGSNTRGYVIAQLAAMMDPSIPKNEGFFDSVELIVPKGCVLNPDTGKTVAAGTHHPGVEVGEALCMALAEILPERACPQIYKLGMPTVIFGVHPETGQMYVDHSVDVLAAYCSAVKGQDGWGSMPASFGNLIRATAEINESIFPTRHEGCDYAIDTGGPGRWRGCPGSRVVKRVLAPASVTTYMVGMKYPMLGVAGGKNGSPNRLTLHWQTPRAKKIDSMATGVAHQAGDAFEYVYGGGAGWGDPLRRDPQAVLDDVLDELVSVESAERDHGVVIVGDEYERRIDWEATKRQREERG